MSAREDQSSPSPQEAFSVLRQLAEVFLAGGARSNADVHPVSEQADPRRPATVLVDEDGRIRGLDSEVERLFGRTGKDLVDLPAGSLLGKLPTSGNSIASRLRRPDGTERPVWIASTELALEQKKYKVLTIHEHDVMGAQRTELRYRHLVEQIPAVVFTAALDGGLYDIYVSPQIENLLGFSQVEWVSNPILWYERLHFDDRRVLDQEFARGCNSGGSFRADCRFLARDNRIVWVHGEARLIHDAHGLPLLLQGVAFDITETKRAEEVARASLREKETLLKEIHHRVKNNLQVTSSLLKLQTDRITDESAQQALRESQSRIRSMALVHELLYRSKDLSRVDLGEYIRDLTRQLLRLHGVDPRRIRVASDLEPVAIAIDHAVPCGLILNELFSNALKHAFPEGRHGTIGVELRQGKGFDSLIVRDDGVGMPADLDVRTGSTLGLRLIRTLVDQIEGQLEFRSEGGTEVRLRIPQRPQERQ